ncbi:MAG TPA: sensor histidine kinase N-terminal domain-containing protein [Rhodocyclaceae bacterium]|nr:sensor histidine kinase N-terminal domain-containing protein [Rhodocyclaceae bacterium]
MKSRFPKLRIGSLRLRVALWLIPPMALMLAVTAVFSYQSASKAVNLAYDRSLAASIKSISERSYIRDGDFVVDIPYSALEVFSDGAQERVFYGVFGPDGKVLTGYTDLPLPPTPAKEGVLASMDMLYRGEPVRIGSMRKRFYDPALQGKDSLVVVVAETIESRAQLANELFRDGLWRQMALLGFGIVLLLGALASAFRPLQKLQDSLRERDAEDLTPIPADQVPSEIRPLIGAINHHTGRIAAMMEARKRFLADAAHQIRTPLAVLNTQAEYGLRQNDPQELRQAMQSLHKSIGGARRLADQMLSLSRAETANGLVLEQSVLDLELLVREAALDLGPLAVKKQIDLSYESDGAALMLMGNAAMLGEMVANLIDNAIRYSPRQGTVLVAVGRKGEDVVLQVIDSGPGIPRAERENVFKRFYRILGQGDVEGSGLGLAIVKEIGAAHGASVSLSDAPGGRGLEVTVRFPQQ